MAIVNSVQRVMAGFGAGAGAGTAAGGYATAAGTALSGASTTTAVTMGTQGYTNGKIRVKVYAGGSSTTALTLTITVTDGTNTYLVASVPAYTIANGTNSGLDMLFDVNVDIQIATVNIITALSVGTTTATLDYEVDLNP